MDHFYPLTWREAWLLVDPDQYEACSTRLALPTVCIAGIRLYPFGIGMPKHALPPAGSYLHRMADVVFGS